jgi:hypothetical protein
MRIRDGKILDPGWKNYYPGSGMNWDKHPRSATLEQGKFLCGVSPSFVDINFSKLKIIIFLNRISAIMYFKSQKLILSSQKYGLVVQELRRDMGLKRTLPRSWIPDLIQGSIKHRIPSVILL